MKETLVTIISSGIKGFIVEVNEYTKKALVKSIETDKVYYVSFDDIEPYNLAAQ